jgi:hypothetical protein
VNTRIPVLIAVVPAALAVAGCGGGKSAAPSTSTPATTPPATTAAASNSPGALQGEAATAATGDIPDNQIFLVYHSPSGWSIKYPEGWAQSGGPNATVFRDKNNIVRVVTRPGAIPTPATVRSDPSLKGARITSGPSAVSLGAQRAIKVIYSTQSPPSPVTGKRLTLTVDRYYVVHAGKVATIDLGTPVGVDNVDAYRLMSESLRWR